MFEKVMQALNSIRIQREKVTGASAGCGRPFPGLLLKLFSRF